MLSILIINLFRAILSIFDDDNRLCAVYVRIANGIFNAAPEVVLSTLDDRRVDVLSEFESSKHIWYYPDYYIHLDKSFFTSEKKTYITVCNYSANKSHSYYELFFLAVDTTIFSMTQRNNNLTLRPDHISMVTLTYIRAVLSKRRI